ncbi:DUF4168 domain-containing protein [Sphingomonas sp. DT-207]|uniref:DUF4168 domain-containing protein n=1 Tax=Sphingomonas sp. DT-207 TaxID=3396167 RepID=UPI003F1E1189
MAFRTSGILIGAALLAAPAAFAQDAPTSPSTQDAPAAPTQDAPATTEAPAAGMAAQGSGAAAVSDSEVTQFATAALAVDKLRKDTTVAEADKNTKMVEAISSSGLQPARFNEIAQAMQADPALNKRIQEAAAAQAPAQ